MIAHPRLSEARNRKLFDTFERCCCGWVSSSRWRWVSSVHCSAED